VKWTPAASGPINNTNFIAFAPVRAKFVRITQTAKTESNTPFAIQNLRVLSPGPGLTPAR
jgi:hypothetical protein